VKIIGQALSQSFAEFFMIRKRYLQLFRVFNFEDIDDESSSGLENRSMFISSRKQPVEPLTIGVSYHQSDLPNYCEKFKQILDLNIWG